MQHILGKSDYIKLKMWHSPADGSHKPSRRWGADLGSTSQHQVSGLADEHASVLHQLLTVEESEASEEVTNLAFTALQENRRHTCAVVNMLLSRGYFKFYNRTLKMLLMNRLNQKMYSDTTESAVALTECGPSMTFTISFTWMLFCSESSATAKRLSFRRFTAWWRTVSTFPCMFNTWEAYHGVLARCVSAEQKAELGLLWRPEKSLSPAGRWPRRSAGPAGPAPPTRAAHLHRPRTPSPSRAAGPWATPSAEERQGETGAVTDTHFSITHLASFPPWLIWFIWT